MKKQYQVTLTCPDGRHKAVSTIINREQNIDISLLTIKTEKAKILNEGLQKICARHLWKTRDLKVNGYTTAKIRLYDKEKIAEENEANYQLIKEAKYASGEWKRPKES